MSIKVVVPQIGQSIAEATIVKWFKKPGDSVDKGEILVEIGTDKINTEIPAPESGIVERLLVQEGETVPVQTEIAVIVSEVERASHPLESPTQRHSPLVRRLAQEHNIDLSQISGTGEGGRITKEDLEKVIQKQQPPEKSRGDEVVPLSRMRKLIAAHMVNSKRSTAELTTFFEVDMTEVVRQRETGRQQGLKLTYLPFVIAATAKALRAFPIVNSSIQGENIHYKKDCNIGIAIAIDEGLIVPVLKKVDEKNVAGIARAAAELAERARAHHLTPEDMSDGTFTITNPGVFGALTGTPIINYPQVAILELGAVVKRAVVIQDAIAIRSMAYFSLTYDHRAMDGAVADSFLAHIKKTLETTCPPALE
ncbi:2-oxo acid dehydrogenase subunit E2 [bacterium]|nr:2-oxo acid dehydrogenase subunit E2 [bacterium]